MRAKNPVLIDDYNIKPMDINSDKMKPIISVKSSFVFPSEL
jgi:hypothetical protein